MKSKILVRIERYFSKIDILKIFLLMIVLVVSMFTRFLPPSHPSNGLVFDESYFVPQIESYFVGRYYFDPHPPLGKFFLYLGADLFNPNAEELVDGDLLGNKVDNYKSPLNIDGIRFFPKVFGSLVPVLIFLITYEILGRKNRSRVLDIGRATWKQIIKEIMTPKYSVALLTGMFASLENSFILESRYALLSQVLIFFMLLPVLLAIRYYNYEGRKAWILEILIALSVGCALSVKWLALSIVPVVLLLVVVKKIQVWRKNRIYKLVLFRNLYNTLLIFIFLPLAIYLGSYYWHFSMIHTYAPAADEVSETYLGDLKNGTNNASFFSKFWDAQQLNLKYEKFVPKLDLTKKDEIGSMWVTWPLMARPIDYYHETADSGTTYAFAYMIGNPFVWYVGLICVLLLTGVVTTSVILPGKLMSTGQIKKNWLLYLSVITLFFANWLPYALITRVMYLYHYLPAVAFAIVSIGVILGDLVLPRLGEISKKVKGIAVSKLFKVGVMLALLFLLCFFFIRYAPFTYIQYLSEEEFNSRVLLKEWNMLYPSER